MEEGRKNIFDDCFPDTFSNDCTFYSDQYNSQIRTPTTSEIKLAEYKILSDEAKEKSTVVQQIEKDINDLNQIMTDLSLLTSSQGEFIDSIEAHVERSSHDIITSQEHLKKAVEAKSAQYPVLAATAGSVAAGGPVGLAAGSALAGIIAAIGGAFAGLAGGRFFKRQLHPDKQCN